MVNLLRLLDKAKRDVYLRYWKDEFDWLPGAIFGRAVVQPFDDKHQLQPTMYGVNTRGMKVLYYEEPDVLKAGMGACLDVAADAPCDYRIIGVESWDGHDRAYLERIPEARRLCGN